MWDGLRTNYWTLVVLTPKDTQPNYQPDAVPLRVSNNKSINWCFTFAFTMPGSTVSTLPITLGNKSIITTSGYSKAPWSLRFPLEVAGIFTGQ